MIDSVTQVASLPVQSTTEAVDLLTSSDRFFVHHRIDDSWLDRSHAMKFAEQFRRPAPHPHGRPPCPSLKTASAFERRRADRSTWIPENRNTTIDVASGPLAVATLDLGTGAFEVRTPEDGAGDLDRAFVLLREHGWPVGVEVLPLTAGAVGAIVGARARR